jgi:large subunit ribosomal protein L17
MRHNKKVNHLGRKSSHRKAMLANMASSLIMHKRIQTTVAKAKALRGYVEPLITKGKNDTTHSRRTVFAYLKDKYAVTELFREVAVKVGDRPGGYTRILKLGTRLGDNADMCIIELVDYNTTYTTDKAGAKPAAKKTRRGKSKKDEVVDQDHDKTAPKTKKAAQKTKNEVVDQKQDVTSQQVDEIEVKPEEENTQAEGKE